MTIAVTGPRPQNMGISYNDVDIYLLASFAIEVLEEVQPDKVITGMAPGFDQAVAMACHVVEVPFIAAVPFQGQENKWPVASQDRYRTLLNAADEVVYVSRIKPVTTGDAIGMMFERNKWMVDRASLLLALWHGRSGGTAHCVKYAESISVPVINVWDKWIKTFKA